MSKVNFIWGFADPAVANGLPKEIAWRCGVIKKTTCVHDLHLAFIKLVQDQYQAENVRVRLHFKLGRINCLYKIFSNPSMVDNSRFIECIPEWYMTIVEKLFEQVGLSCIISVKIEDGPWSWEYRSNPSRNLKLGIIYDLKDTRNNYYQAVPVSYMAPSWRFHYISWKPSWDEWVSLSTPEKRVFSRGIHTIGYHHSSKIENDYIYLYPPYPEQKIADNKDIKLGSFCRNKYAKIINDAILSLGGYAKSSPQNLLECLKNDIVCRDVTLVLRGGVIIQVHMTILAVFSPVFRKMFTSNMIEGNSKSVELLDVNPEAMQIFVDCLYGVALPNLKPDILEELLWLSDKYHVDFLIPKLLKKLNHVPVDDLFHRMFEVFRKIRLLQDYLAKYKKHFVMNVLRIPPRSRTQGMQDFLLEAQLSDDDDF